MSEAQAVYGEAYEDSTVALPEEAPFQVGEEIEVGDLSRVQRSVLPVARDVRFEVQSTAVAKTSSGFIKYLKVKLRIVNGIPSQNDEGELVMKYANKVCFPGVMDLCIWHDPAGPDPKGWWKAQESTREYNLGLKQFWVALGNDPSKVVINDTFHVASVGKHILGSISHETDKQTGRISEKFGNWKAAPAEEV